jgi:hypothetical protein
VSKSAKQWAIRARLKLITELGGKCANPECNEEEYEKLTFDHIYGKDWEATGLSTDQRMCRYMKEHKLGLLQVLCLTCNSKRGDPRDRELKEKIRILFKLGGQCAHKCESVYIGDLEFVHIDPEWKPGEVRGDDLVAAYAREMDADRCIILCPRCRGDEEADIISFPLEDVYNCKVADGDPF